MITLAARNRVTGIWWLDILVGMIGVAMVWTAMAHGDKAVMAIWNSTKARVAAKYGAVIAIAIAGSQFVPTGLIPGSGEDPAVTLLRALKGTGFTASVDGKTVSISGVVDGQSINTVSKMPSENLGEWAKGEVDRLTKVARSLKDG